MKKFETEKIRNIGLFAHQGTGKTTLTESMLYNAKAIDRMGRVEEGNTVSDFDPDENKRAISISLSMAPFICRETKVNCIDVPGFLDFVAEVKSALRVIDGAVFLLSANSGIEVGFEKVWEYSQNYHMSKMIFINKMDKENTDFYKLVGQIREKFTLKAIPVQLPIGNAEKFTGVVDLIEGKAYIYESGKIVKDSIPADMEAHYKQYREKLMEVVAESDDELLNKYLMEGIELTNAEIIKGLKKGVETGKVIPILCGSAVKNIAVQNLMDAIVDYIPSPLAIETKGFNPKTKTQEVRTADSKAPFSAFVFKTTTDPYVGRLNLMRIYSGTLSSDSTVYNSSKEKDEKISNLIVMKGKHQENVNEAATGDIITVAKLQHTHTGDTLCTKDHPIIYPSIEFPKPVISMAVFPKSKGDEDKLGSGINRLMEEDPTFKVERNVVTKETVISGMGDLHLEINMDRLKRKFGVEVELATPKIPYKETVKSKAKSEHKHKKQSGGRGQYGHVLIELEPLERGKDFEFVDRIVGGVIPKNYIPSVEKGIRDAMSGGVIAGYPVVDLRVSLYDGSFHTVDSSDMAFKIAGSMAFKKAVNEAKPILLEPIMNIEILIPDSNMGDCIGDLNSKRGRVQGMEPGEKNGYQSIKAQVPLAEVQKYAIDLRSITQGRGTFYMNFSHYEEVPGQIAEHIIEKCKKDKEEEEE